MRGGWVPAALPVQRALDVARVAHLDAGEGALSVQWPMCP